MNPAFQAMYNLLQSDRRYKFEAYNFVRESLNQAQQARLSEAGSDPTDADLLEETSDPSDETAPTDPPSRHITGQQLCEACRIHAMEQYGFMASKVLSSWGIRSTSDFGEIVYNLIRIDQMRKSESDRREDFDGVFSFETAFVPEFKLPPTATQ